jgi:hypothetical protein
MVTLQHEQRNKASNNREKAHWENQHRTTGQAMIVYDPRKRVEAEEEGERPKTETEATVKQQTQRQQADRSSETKQTQKTNHDRQEKQTRQNGAQSVKNTMTDKKNKPKNNPHSVVGQDLSYPRGERISPLAVQRALG